MLLRYYKRVKKLERLGWYKNSHGGYTQSHCMNFISFKELMFWSNKDFNARIGKYIYSVGGVYSFNDKLYVYMKREDTGKDVWLVVYCGYSDFKDNPRAWCELGDIVRYNTDFGRYFKRLPMSMGKGYIEELVSRIQ